MSHPLIDTRTGYRVSFDTNLARSRRIHRLQARAARDVSQQIASEVVVVGAGAAGLTAAYFAASQGAQVRISKAATYCNSRALCTAACRRLLLGACISAFYEAAPTQVTVLEKNREAGKKVLISGGTRWYVCVLAFAIAARQPPMTGCFDAAMCYPPTPTLTRTTSQSPSLEL